MTDNSAFPFSQPKASDSTGLLLWQLTTQWQRAINAALKPHALTQVQFVLLASLLWLTKSEPCITQIMLARHTKLDVMMTSQVLRNLEKRGLILRLPHPRDIRAKMLALTSAGHALAIQAVPAVEGVDELYFGQMGEERAVFNARLCQLIEN
ncbi:MarR family winged helix-turn-helix transcriptional regulator [Deefgea sp. CFH1-16]|uniref:MarR family winged helix-turn-helix transcriptional regulator n=1 Tax=Deefgea sp. CFH1-16 TaxID=2675457 RepID=UPI0015F48BC9|nr:MarR family transcriptional regulator [Deefgea sp. CFH1-16]MBM5574693.1 MarR family transcriptional regulator [Deefgea sp. CFH1-16]